MFSPTRITAANKGRRWTTIVTCLAITLVGLVIPTGPAAAADVVRLSVTTTNSDPFVESSDDFTMTTTITNIGTVAVPGIRIFERAPDGFAPIDGWWPDGTALSYLPGTLEPGATTEYSQRFFGEGEPGFSSTYAINVSSEQPGEELVVTTPCSPGSLNSCADVTIVGSPQLALTLQVDRLTAEPGDLLTYSMLLTSEFGGSDAGVTVRDLLPDGVTFVSASPAAASVEPGSGVPGHDVAVLWAPVAVDTETPVEYQLTVRVNNVADTTLVNNVRAFAETALVVDRAPCPYSGFWPNGGSCVTTTVGTAPVAAISSTLQACSLPSPTLCDPAQDGWWVDDATLPRDGKFVVYRLLFVNTGDTALSDINAGVSVFDGQVGVRTGTKVSQGSASFPEWHVGALQPAERASWLFRARLPAALGEVRAGSGASALSGETGTSLSVGSSVAVTVGTNQDFADSVLGRFDSADVISFVRAWLAAHR